MDQAEMDAALAAHERFLRGSGGTRIILRFVEATGLDCRRRLLNDADFTGARLEGSQFAGSHLERASFYCADLRGCDLRSSNLRRSDLRGASLAGAALNGAMLDAADMRAACIVEADSKGGFRTLPRPGTNGVVQDGLGADFTNCAMRGVRLRDANLKGANFSGAILDGADLTGAKLIGALFHGAVLTSVAMSDMALSAEQLGSCVLDPGPEAVARAVRLRAMIEQAGEWVETGGKCGAAAVLDNEDLRPLRGAFRGRVLSALSARAVCAIGVDFSGCELQGANFDGADLRGASFDSADVRGATFRDAQLSHAQFRGADLSALVLPDGSARLPNFTGAALDRTDFSLTVLEHPGPARTLALAGDAA